MLDAVPVRNLLSTTGAALSLRDEAAHNVSAARVLKPQSRARFAHYQIFRQIIQKA